MAVAMTLRGAQVACAPGHGLGTGLWSRSATPITRTQYLLAQTTRPQATADIAGHLLQQYARYSASEVYTQDPNVAPAALSIDEAQVYTKLVGGRIADESPHGWHWYTKRYRVCILDDEVALARMVGERVCEPLGLPYVCCKNPGEVWAAFRRYDDIGILLSDTNVYPYFGPDVLEDMRADTDAIPFIPAIGFSGDRAADSVWLKMGAEQFIWRGNDLCASLHQYLSDHFVPRPIG